MIMAIINNNNKDNNANTNKKECIIYVSLVNLRLTVNEKNPLNILYH